MFLRREQRKCDRETTKPYNLVEDKRNRITGIFNICHGLYEGTRVCLEMNRAQSASEGLKKLQLMLMGEILNKERPT